MCGAYHLGETQVGKRNSKWLLRTAAYIASSTKNNTLIEKWQMKESCSGPSEGSKLWGGKHVAGK